MGGTRGGSADKDTGVEAAFNRLEEIARLIVASGDDDLIVGLIECIEDEVQLIRIDVMVGVVEGFAAGNRVDRAAWESLNDFIEKRFAAQQIVETLARVESRRAGKSLTTRAPIDDENVLTIRGNGFREFECFS